MIITTEKRLVGKAVWKCDCGKTMRVYATKATKKGRSRCYACECGARVTTIETVRTK